MKALEGANEAANVNQG